jgi:DNA polymerase Ligase (LigD)
MGLPTAPRFVVLEHDHPFLHWDLMLEAGESLRTWRLAAPPSAGVEVEATPLGEHRRLYLDYEGPVSDGRGRVARWDHGTFAWERQGEELVAVRLDGGRLRGLLRLWRRTAESWRASFEPAP